jgi:hypothetical protein
VAQTAGLYSPDTQSVGSAYVAEQQVRVGIKVAQMTGLYNEGMRDAWLEADRLGFDTGWLHDHLLNQNDPTGIPPSREVRRGSELLQGSSDVLRATREANPCAPTN